MTRRSWQLARCREGRLQDTEMVAVAGAARDALATPGAARDAFATVSAAKGTLATLGRFAGEVRP